MKNANLATDLKSPGCVDKLDEKPATPLRPLPKQGKNLLENLTKSEINQQLGRKSYQFEIDQQSTNLNSTTNQVQKLARTHRQVNSLARAVVPHVNLSNLTLFMESQPK